MIVLDLDRFEMAAQALEYERARGSQTLQPFFDSSIPHLCHAEVRVGHGSTSRARGDACECRLQIRELSGYKLEVPSPFF